MTTLARSTSAENLLGASEDQSKWCELVEGEIVHKAPSGAMHGMVAANLGGLLHGYVRKHQLGAVFAAGTGFIAARNPDTVLAPDGAFVRRPRIAAHGIPRSYFPEVPALVFEVLSPGDSAGEIAVRMRRWLVAGVELAWVVDPASRTANVYRSGENACVLTGNDCLSGADVVPGFECRLAELFTIA